MYSGLVGFDPSQLRGTPARTVPRLAVMGDSRAVKSPTPRKSLTTTQKESGVGEEVLTNPITQSVVLHDHLRSPQVREWHVFSTYRFTCSMVTPPQLATK
jgi:hypothetical protein